VLGIAFLCAGLGCWLLLARGRERGAFYAAEALMLIAFAGRVPEPARESIDVLR